MLASEFSSRRIHQGRIKSHQGTCTTDVLLRIRTEQNSIRTAFPLNDVLCKWIALTSMRSNFVSLLWDMIISIVMMAGHIFPSSIAMLLAEMEDSCGSACMGYRFRFEDILAGKLAGALPGQNIPMLF